LSGGGSSDAFISKLNSTGSALVYSTYLGGSDLDGAYGIAVDSSGSAYVTGYTASTNFPITPGVAQSYFGGWHDGFVTKLTSDGSALAYSTFLGGNYYDGGYAIAIDSSGNAYVTGSTWSSNFSTTAGAVQSTYSGSNDGFITELNSNASALIYSTYLGSSNYEYGTAIAVDASGNVYVSGYTNSPGFPRTNAYQSSLAGGYDVFVTKVNLASKSDTITTINSITSPISFGQSSTVAVTVSSSSGSPTGAVNISDGLGGTGDTCTITLSSGSGTCQLTPSAVSAGLSISAAYQGDTGYKPSNAAPGNLVVNKANSTTAITSVVSPIHFGQSATVNVTVSGQYGGTPGGIVNISDGLGGPSDSCSFTLSSGSGSCQLTPSGASPAGLSISAAYQGDDNFKSSNASPVTMVVNKADTTTSIGMVSSPINFGQSSIVSVTVSSAAGSPTGTVNVSDGLGGATDSCSFALSSGTGSCQLTPSSASSGLSISATYDGTSNFNGSGSTKTAALVVNKANTSSTISSISSPISFGQTSTVSVSVTSAAGMPGGSVIVSDGLGGGGDSCSITLSSGTGACQLAPSAANPGGFSVSAAYQGNSNYQGSSAAAAVLVVNKADTATTFVSIGSPIAFGQSSAVEVTVSSPAGTPTGSVNVSDGLGGAGDSCVINSLSSGSGSCQLTPSAASVGGLSVNAAYQGDSNFNTSSAAPGILVVNRAATTIAVTSMTSPVVLGQSSTINVTVNPQYGGVPSGSVNVSDGLGGTGDACTITLFAGSGSCQLTPSAPGVVPVNLAYTGDEDFNSATFSDPLDVQYAFVGLQAPYAPPSTRTFKVGSSIPLVWQYTNSGGTLANSANANPQVSIIQAVCGGQTGGTEVIVSSSGNSGYQYNSTTSTWQFNWKTSSSADPAGCYSITIRSSQTNQANGPFLIQLAN
jgi:hypothetical protein